MSELVAGNQLTAGSGGGKASNLQMGCLLKAFAKMAHSNKQALAAAKKRGVKLGGWNAGSERSQRKADELADKMRPVMEVLAPLSAHKAAEGLNRRSIKSATGSVWYPATVLRLRERLA